MDGRNRPSYQAHAKIHQMLLAPVIFCALGCGTTLSPMAGPSTTGSATKAPVITANPSGDLTEGLDYQYQIQALNNPTNYSAIGLPPGLSVDTSSGLIEGAPSTEGDYAVTLSARNSHGTATASLQMHVSSQSGFACASNVTAPAAASAAGFDNLVFCDDFNSSSTIDVNATGNQGFNWYTALPRWFGSHTPASDYSLSNSVITLSQSRNTANWALATQDPITGAGRSWVFGYFEARIKFDPKDVTSSNGWPSFWGLSSNAARNSPVNLWGELDFFEAGNRVIDFYGTVHQWEALPGGSVGYANSNYHQSPKVNWNTWQTVGCLWKPGAISWFLNGKPLMTQYYSQNGLPSPQAAGGPGLPPAPSGTFSELEHDGQEVVIGTGPNFPLEIDWVRVWHN